MQDTQAEAFGAYAPLAQRWLRAAPAPAATDGAHDMAHVLRVWRNACRIAAVEGGDRELLAAAVLLHDCVAVEKNSPLRAQASRLSAERAQQWLSEQGWPAERCLAVAHAIAAHSFSAGIAPQTLEARILQDADRLDALGAIGIARCFYTAGRLGAQLYSPQDPRGVQRAHDDRRYALDHFPQKLLTLSTGFQTAQGAALAQARHQMLLGFYETLLDEVADTPAPADTIRPF